MHFHTHKHNIETFLKTWRILLLLLSLLFYFNPRYSSRFLYFKSCIWHWWKLCFRTTVVVVRQHSPVVDPGRQWCGCSWYTGLILCLYCTNVCVATQRIHGHVFQSYVRQEVVCKFIHLGYTISAFFVF